MSKTKKDGSQDQDTITRFMIENYITDIKNALFGIQLILMDTIRSKEANSHKRKTG